VNQLENTKDPLHISSGLIGFSGSMFTRTNWQCNKPILEKLDWVLVNMKWKCEFSTSKATFLLFGISDHSSMLKKLVSMPKRKTPFKFFDFGLIILNLIRQLPRHGRWKSLVLVYIV
jgi:hypothetical protein